MHIKTYSIGNRLGMPRVLSVCLELDSLPSAEAYELDFSDVQHIEPFGALVVASAIRRLRERTLANGGNPAVQIVGKDLSKQGHAYAHRLGFWWSIGDDTGMPSVMKSSSETTIPITRINYDELFKQAGYRDPIRAEVVGDAAATLATTLSGGREKTSLWLTLEYCFREMFRNVFEHGRTDSVWFTGSTRPTRDDVQIAIIDSGRGIRDSLADHSEYKYLTDLQSIHAALRPGVSRNSGKTRSADMTQKLREEFPGQNPELYENSGYGLTLTSYLGRDAGQFAVVSGSASVAYIGQSEALSETRHKGTAIRLVLQPSKLDGALERARLKADRHSATSPRSGSLITASMMARLGLDESKPTHLPP